MGLNKVDNNSRKYSIVDPLINVNEFGLDESDSYLLISNNFGV